MPRFTAVVSFGGGDAGAGDDGNNADGVVAGSVDAAAATRADFTGPVTGAVVEEVPAVAPLSRLTRSHVATDVLARIITTLNRQRLRIRILELRFPSFGPIPERNRKVPEEQNQTRRSPSLGCVTQTAGIVLLP